MCFVNLQGSKFASVICTVNECPEDCSKTSDPFSPGDPEPPCSPRNLSELDSLGGLSHFPLCIVYILLLFVFVQKSANAGAPCRLSAPGGRHSAARQGPRSRVCIESPIKQQSEEVIQCVATDCYALVNPAFVHPTGQPGASPLESSESSLCSLWSAWLCESVFFHAAKRRQHIWKLEVL
jgi:hypothetical protein